jgi:hypothetical protein
MTAFPFLHPVTPKTPRAQTPRHTRHHWKRHYTIAVSNKPS